MQSRRVTCEVPCLFRFVLVGEIQRDFVGVFNKTIIPLALVGYEMIIANSARYAPPWLSTISYPTRPRGIIVKYNHKKRDILTISKLFNNKDHINRFFYSDCVFWFLGCPVVKAEIVNS